MELIRIEDGKPVLSSEASKRFAQIEATLKEFKEYEKNLKKQLLKEMEAKGVIGIETEELLITYVPAYDREQFDGKRFRSEHDDLYDKYVSMTTVSASVRVKVKGE